VGATVVDTGEDTVFVLRDTNTPRILLIRARRRVSDPMRLVADEDEEVVASLTPS
jgi:hypothetical protein